MNVEYEVLYTLRSPGGKLWNRASGAQHDTRESAQAEVDQIRLSEPTLFSASIIKTTWTTDKEVVFQKDGD